MNHSLFQIGRKVTKKKWNMQVFLKKMCEMFGQSKKKQ